MIYFYYWEHLLQIKYLKYVLISLIFKNVSLVL